MSCKRVPFGKERGAGATGSLRMIEIDRVMISGNDFLWHGVPSYLCTRGMGFNLLSQMLCYLGNNHTWIECSDHSGLPLPKNNWRNLIHHHWQWSPRLSIIFIWCVHVDSLYTCRSMNLCDCSFNKSSGWTAFLEHARPNIYPWTIWIDLLNSYIYRFASVYILVEL